MPRNIQDERNIREKSLEDDALIDEYSSPPFSSFLFIAFVELSLYCQPLSIPYLTSTIYPSSNAKCLPFIHPFNRWNLLLLGIFLRCVVTRQIFVSKLCPCIEIRNWKQYFFLLKPISLKNNGEITDNYGFCYVVASTVPIESQRQYNDSERRSTNGLGWYDWLQTRYSFQSHRWHSWYLKQQES